jgi:RNA polymerase sigma-70 factor (ECF subfamily)
VGVPFVRERGARPHAQLMIVPADAVPVGVVGDPTVVAGSADRLDGRAIALQDELVARAQAGDRAAIGLLYEQHRGRVYQFFLKRVQGRTQSAEDLTSEVFVRALQRLEGYECRGLPFSAWLFRIAQNLLVDHIRRQPREPSLVLEACQQHPAPLGERWLDRAADRCDLARALRRLTREQRRVLELRFVRGLSVAETTALVGRSEEAVKKLQARGLARLRVALRGPR